MLNTFNNTKNIYIIGISGRSASGKTKFCNDFC